MFKSMKRIIQWAGKYKGRLWEELRKEVPPKTFVKSAVCD